jgi:hypothetical protein
MLSASLAIVRLANGKRSSQKSFVLPVKEEHSLLGRIPNSNLKAIKLVLSKFLGLNMIFNKILTSITSPCSTKYVKPTNQTLI